MIVLHHLEYSQSFRILWLLEEIGIDYELKIYQRDPVTHLAPADYKAISPTGTAPVITHKHVVLSETAAIMDYLMDLYPNDVLRPSADSPNRVRHLFWFHAAQASIMPLMLMESVFYIVQKRLPSLLNLVVKPIFAKVSAGFTKARMVSLLEQAEQDLARAKWFGGEALTLADILLSYPLESAKKRGFLNQDYPLTLDWLARIQARPAFIQAKEKDGCDSMILPI